MKNQKEQKGYQLTEKGEQAYSNKDRNNKGADRSAANKNQDKNNPRIPAEKLSNFEPAQKKGNKPLPNSEQVSKFIDEGNPNTQPVKQPEQGKQKDQAGLLGLRPQSFSSRPDYESSPQSSAGFADQRDMNNTGTGFKEEGVQSKSAGVDSDVAKEIKEDIRRDSSLLAVKEGIYVTVESGVATLTGRVSTEEQKITAGNKAIAHVGRENVNNYINVTYSNEV